MGYYYDHDYQYNDHCDCSYCTGSDYAAKLTVIVFVMLSEELFMPKMKQGMMAALQAVIVLFDNCRVAASIVTILRFHLCCIAAAAVSLLSGAGCLKLHQTRGTEISLVL